MATNSLLNTWNLDQMIMYVVRLRTREKCRLGIYLQKSMRPNSLRPKLHIAGPPTRRRRGDTVANSLKTSIKTARCCLVMRHVRRDDTLRTFLQPRKALR